MERFYDHALVPAEAISIPSVIAMNVGPVSRARNKRAIHDASAPRGLPETSSPSSLRVLGVEDGPEGGKDRANGPEHQALLNLVGTLIDG